MIQIIIYILLAILSLFGFVYLPVLSYRCSTDKPHSLIGAISRKRSFVRSYLWMIFVHLLISIGLGIYAIVRNFKEAPKYVEECASGSEDPSVLKSCEDGSKLFKIIMIAVFVFVWLLEICQFFIYFISVAFAHFFN